MTDVAEIARPPHPGATTMKMTDERLAELDAVVAKATVAFPITSCDTEDYAEITFGSSQTQAMSMEPETLLAINDVFAAVPDLRAHIDAQAATIARLTAALTDPPTHRYWGAGEPDCPRDILAGNGELHTLRCKVCGNEDARSRICLAAIGAA